MRLKLMLGLSIFWACCALAAEPPAPDSKRALLEAEILRTSAVIQKNPQDPQAYLSRARARATLGEGQLAVADYNQVLKLAPERADVFDERGSQHFILGDVERSIEDFDRFIQLRPQAEISHWKRGISYYYAERYPEGRRQFEGYQTFDDNDVENAVWRYLCMARADGVPAARAAMLKIKRDLRVPMMQVYDLYRGTVKPEDVMAAVTAGNPSAAELNNRQFYAHLYLGLYYESLGDGAGAFEHIRTAAEQHKIGHYMWNVADVHAKRLTAKQDSQDTQKDSN